jgi:hypothetical protein
MPGAAGNKEDKGKDCTGQPECASLHKKFPILIWLFCGAPRPDRLAHHITTAV